MKRYIKSNTDVDVKYNYFSNFVGTDKWLYVDIDKKTTKYLVKFLDETPDKFYIEYVPVGRTYTDKTWINKSRIAPLHLTVDNGYVYPKRTNNPEDFIKTTQPYNFTEQLEELCKNLLEGINFTQAESIIKQIIKDVRKKYKMDSGYILFPTTDPNEQMRIMDKIRKDAKNEALEMFLDRFGYEDLDDVPDDLYDLYDWYEMELES